MNASEKALSQRIRELRRRHYGARGKDEFARRLGLTREQYESFEEGVIPPGELMVRMCEITGEDLQWLLTGVGSRGTVVISGARRRHQDLLTRIAQTLDAEPKHAAALEAFFDLLTHAGGARKSRPVAELPDSRATLLPILDGVWPDELPDPDDPGGGRALVAPTAAATALARAKHVPALLIEPAPESRAPALRQIDIVSAGGGRGKAARFLDSAELVNWFSNAFGLAWPDTGMEPMFTSGDVLLVCPGITPRLGRPAACKFRDPGRDACGIWLGEEHGRIQLGRVADGGHEDVPRERLCWALEVLYRLTPAA